MRPLPRLRATWGLLRVRPSKPRWSNLRNDGRRTLAVTALLSTGLALLTGAGAAHAQGPQANPPTRTPIKHFITLLQENHTFDNYFGTYPGAEGIPANVCMPVDPLSASDKQCVKPFHLGDQPITELGESRPIAQAQFDNGKMDGFVSALMQRNVDGRIAMGYYDGSDISYYWNLADNFVLFDRWFSSAMDGSFANHAYWVAAQPLQPSAQGPGYADMTTIFDRLDEKGISWKFYVQNYDPTINYRTVNQLFQNGAQNANRESQVIWVPLLNMDRFLDDPKLMSHIVDLSQYYQDLNDGTLPAVSYIVPSGASEHPPGRIQSGEKFVKQLLQELERSSSWDSSAFMLAYDDWGGWYDHVPPPQVDAYGYGFRVPCLLISPYARKHLIDSTQLDYTSMLKFIEENWGLQPITSRDAQANNFLEAFDFARPPRAPEFVSSVRGAPEPRVPNIFLIYAFYGTALLLAVGVIGWALVHRRRLPPIDAEFSRGGPWV